MTIAGFDIGDISINFEIKESLFESQKSPISLEDVKAIKNLTACFLVDNIEENQQGAVFTELKELAVHGIKLVEGDKASRKPKKLIEEKKKEQPIIEEVKEKENSEIEDNIKLIEKETALQLKEKIAELAKQGVKTAILRTLLDKVKGQLEGIKSRDQIDGVIEAAVDEVVGKIEIKKEENPVLRQIKRPVAPTPKTVKKNTPPSGQEEEKEN